MPKQKPKRGPLSISRANALISQAVLKSRSFEVTVEIRTMAGEVLLSQQLPEPPASHQLLPDGRTVLLAELARFDDNPDISYALRLLDMETGEKRSIGRASSFHIAVAADRIACFCGDNLTVMDLHGTDLLSLPMAYDEEHHALAFLPDRRLAVSTGIGADESLADIVLLNTDTGIAEARYDCVVSTSYNNFAPGVLAVDPRGELLALAGHYAGLVIFDLRSGANIADRFAPHPLDLADGHVATHDHHDYGDIVFDESGRFLAAALRPGWVSLWTRESNPVLREKPFLNPKGERLIAFDDGELVYLDTMGDSARFPVPV